MPTQDLNEDDNKRYRGKLDRMYVSLSEEYEVNHFIDEFLETHGAAINAKNRDSIRLLLKRCPLKAPIKRDELTKWVASKTTIS